MFTAFGKRVMTVPGACDSPKKEEGGRKLPPSEVIFKFSHSASYQAALSLQAALKGLHIPPLSAVLLTIPALPLPVMVLHHSEQHESTKSGLLHSQEHGQCPFEHSGERLQYHRPPPG